jgi:hypothetical protein
MTWYEALEGERPTSYLPALPGWYLLEPMVEPTDDNEERLRVTGFRRRAVLAWVMNATPSGMRDREWTERWVIDAIPILVTGECPGDRYVPALFLRPDGEVETFDGVFPLDESLREWVEEEIAELGEIARRRQKAEKTSSRGPA